MSIYITRIRVCARRYKNSLLEAKRKEARRGEIADVARTLAMVAGWILARRAARTFSSCRYRGASRRFSRPPLRRFSPWVERQPAAGPLKSSATFHAIPTTHPIKPRLTSPRLAKPSLAPRALSPIHLHLLSYFQRIRSFDDDSPFDTKTAYNSKYVSLCLLPLLLVRVSNRANKVSTFLFNFLSYS